MQPFALLKFGLIFWSVGIVLVLNAVGMAAKAF